MKSLPHAGFTFPSGLVSVVPLSMYLSVITRYGPRTILSEATSLSWQYITQMLLTRYCWSAVYDLLAIKVIRLLGYTGIAFVDMMKALLQ